MLNFRDFLLLEFIGMDDFDGGYDRPAYFNYILSTVFRRGKKAVQPGAQITL